ncbi:MAG: MAE_28990/MAE_18760 family HEPN-like nuclease [Nodosilinea sp.]
MAKLLFDNFKREINQIREYILHTQLTNEFAACALQDESVRKGYTKGIDERIKSLSKHYKRFRTNKRIFEYKAAIISLYGLLEKTIEECIKEYLEEISVIVTEYEKLDIKLQENHFDLSLKLISIIAAKDFAKYQHLKKEDVLRKLGVCIDNLPSYKINAEAFTLSSGNLKHSKITDLFKFLNIDLNMELKSNEAFVAYLQDRYELRDISQLKLDFLYSKIDDLVIRRNAIAHGSGDVDAILDFSEIEPYIEFIESYCHAIFEILTKEIIKNEIVHQCQVMGIIEDVIDNKILIVRTSDLFLSIGDEVIIENSVGKLFKKTVEEIQIDKVSRATISIREETRVGIKLSSGFPKIKENCKFYARI